jgi:hypothetical protein
MGTVLASTLITRAQNIVVDTGTGTRWLAAEWLDWLNAGQWEIASICSDAFTKASNATLVAGTRQTVPTDCILVLHPTRNMGSDGATPGAPIRSVSEKVLDAAVPDWHTATADVTSDFAYNPSLRNVFWVYPPAVAGNKIELVYVGAPAAVTASGNPISIDDVYQNALTDYMLYRAFSKDIEVDGTVPRAAGHRSVFESALAEISKTTLPASQDNPK